MVILHSYVSLPEGSDWCFTQWVYNSDIVYSKDGIVTDGTLMVQWHVLMVFYPMA